jgi:hypothetical protein
MILAPLISIAPRGDDAWDGLAPALGRLDALLAKPVAIARLPFGEQAASDPYRGLQITQDTVERVLATPPGTPLLFSEGAAEAAPGHAERRPLARVREALGLEPFDLEPFDLDVLVIALAPELDLRYERLYGYLQDDVTRRRPTVDLALNLLCRNAAEKLKRRGRFLPEAPLLRHGLIELVADPSHVAPPLLGQYLRLDPQILRRLLGQGGLEASLAQFCELVPPRPAPGAPGDPAMTSAPHRTRGART